MPDKEVQKSFERFHANNPHVYKLLKKQIIRAIKLGKTKISINHVMSFLVWEMYLDTTDDSLVTDTEGVQHSFRINHNYNPLYSRLFANEFPKYANIFNYRSLKEELVDVTDNEAVIQPTE